MYGAKKKRSALKVVIDESTKMKNKIQVSDTATVRFLSNELPGTIILIFDNMVFPSNYF